MSNPWRWPLIALIILVVIVIGGVVLALNIPHCTTYVVDGVTHKICRQG